MLRSCIEWRSRGDLFGKCCHTKIRRSFRYRLIMVSLPGEKMREGGKYEDLKIAIPVGKNRRHRNLENNKRHNEKKQLIYGWQLKALRQGRCPLKSLQVPFSSPSSTQESSKVQPCVQWKVASSSRVQVLTFSVVNKDGVYNTGSKMKELQCTTVLKG